MFTEDWHNMLNAMHVFMVEEFRNTRGVLCAHNKSVFVKFQNIAKTFLGTHPTLAKKVTELWFIGRLGGDWGFILGNVEQFWVNIILMISLVITIMIISPLQHDDDQHHDNDQQDDQHDDHLAVHGRSPIPSPGFSQSGGVFSLPPSPILNLAIIDHLHYSELSLTSPPSQPT